MTTRNLPILFILFLFLFSACSSSTEKPKLDEKTISELNASQQALQNRIDSLKVWQTIFLNEKKEWLASRPMDSIKMAIEKMGDPALRLGREALYNELVTMEYESDSWDTSIHKALMESEKQLNKFLEWKKTVEHEGLSTDSIHQTLSSLNEKIKQQETMVNESKERWKKFLIYNKEAIESFQPMLNKLKKK